MAESHWVAIISTSCPCHTLSIPLPGITKHYPERASSRAEQRSSLSTTSALDEAFTASLSTLALLFRKTNV